MTPMGIRAANAPVCAGQHTFRGCHGLRLGGRGVRVLLDVGSYASEGRSVGQKEAGGTEIDCAVAGHEPTDPAVAMGLRRRHPTTGGLT